MPQNPIMVFAKEDGTPTYMHTVDAAEAVRLGDYTVAPPDKEVSPEARASAMSRFKTGQATTHPEMQTDEEKEKTREEANAKAEMLAGVPEGAQVVVMAAPKGETAASSRSGSAGARSSAPASQPSPPAGQTPRRE
jgi:hypothetical protein